MTIFKHAQLLVILVLTFCLSSCDKKTGSLKTHDKRNNPVTLEWTKIGWNNFTEKNVPLRSLISFQYQSLIKDISQLYSRTFGPYDAGFLESINVGPNISGQYYLIRLKNKENTLVGLAGFLVSNINPKEALLEPLAIISEAQGLGLAKLLIFSIEKIETDISTISLHVEKDNKHACDIYRHYGFEIAGEFFDKETGKIIVKYKRDKRETVLDHIEHIEATFKEVPAVSSLCDTLPRLTKKFIQLRDGAKLYYEEEGHGIPLVLLAGGPGNTHQGFHPYFSSLVDSARVIYFDFRGCGKSDYIKGKLGYSADQAVDDLDDLRKSLGIEKWIVLGHSNGGFLAQYYAKKYAPNVAGLILVCADFDAKIQEEKLKDDYADQRMHNSAREKQRIQELMKFFAQKNDGLALLDKDRQETVRQQNLSQIIYNRWLNGDWKRQCFYLPSDEEIARMARYIFVSDTEYASAMCNSQRNVDISSFDGSIPTLLIEGKYDLTWNPCKKPAILQSIHPQARLIMFDRSAHSPFADEPEKFINALESFISRR